MTIKYSAAVRNARLAAIETAIGAAPVLKIRSGAAPAAVSDADSGTVLVTIALPSDWMAAPSAGVVGKTGVWSGNASAAGTAGHFRLYANDGTTPHLQGSITLTGGGGDMTVDDVALTVNQLFTVNSFNITGGNG